MFFPSVHRALTREDPILGHKASLSQLKHFKSYKVHPLFTKKLSEKSVFTGQKENKVIV